MTSVTRTDLINDDLGALTAVPQRIGRGGALKINDVFWASFLDDGSFFTTGKGNKKTSATALGLAGLKEALALYRKLKDTDGKPMAVQPRVLLVPVDLEITAAADGRRVFRYAHELAARRAGQLAAAGEPGRRASRGISIRSPGRPTAGPWPPVSKYHSRGGGRPSKYHE